MIDQNLFQIIMLALTGITTLLFFMVKMSISGFRQKMDWLESISVDHEKRITENAKDIEANGKQDLVKSDMIARSMDDVKVSIRDVAADVKGLSQRVTDYIILQKN